MEAHYLEFLSMLVRWLHIIAGIAWIGSSFYFIWLDNSLSICRGTRVGQRQERCVAGELWAVHGGGFYNPQKYAVAPADPPDNGIGLSGRHTPRGFRGTAFLMLVYWLKAQVMMVDPECGHVGLLPGRRSRWAERA